MSRILENRLKPYIFGTLENRKEKARMLLMGTILETVGRKTICLLWYRIRIQLFITDFLKVRK